MIARGVGRALAGLALVLITVAACDNNPLADDRDQAAYFRLNPSNVAVNAGGEVKVDAVLVNKFGGGLNQAVAATPCDNKITAVADTGRSVFEFPERFVITGVTLGMSCLVVRGGGVEDTIGVRVVPASLAITGVEEPLPSGVARTAQVRFLNEQGQPVTGFTVSDVTLTIGSSTIGVIDATGAISARAPGTTTVTATLDPRFGVTRSVTTNVTVVAGPFTGTVAQSTATGGQYVTFTAGALAFDADTEIRVQVPSGFWATITPSIVSRAAGNTITVMLPPGLPAGSVLSYDIINLGANQVAVKGTFTTTTAAPAVDTWGAAPAGGPASAPTITVFNDVFGTIPGIDQTAEEWFCFVAARTGSHTMTVHWDDGSDIDVYLTNSAGTAALSARETLANPEVGSANLTSGTRYCVLLFVWSSTVANRQIPYRIRVQ
ncbi:MAG TPA: hypothetical protein VMN60_09775 [Longimicrobiales bacterium]|nr:hypothetical protein [Longimicrobiales bacterium]